VRAAAQAYGVLRSTLQGWMQGAQTHTIAHSNQQGLAVEQESSPIDYSNVNYTCTVITTCSASSGCLNSLQGSSVGLEILFVKVEVLFATRWDLHYTGTDIGRR
jgi:hypothetical protein